MALNPEAQRTAQHELDSVLGPDRIPTFSDREFLPYINALCIELIRLYYPSPTGERIILPSKLWCLILFSLPQGLPHRVTREDEYLGYRIPAGATVIANNW